MTISSSNLMAIRDEVGTQPDENTLEEWFDELGHWLPVAIRVLKRRYADASAGGQEVASFGLDGVLNVGFSKASLPGLAAQIARLKERWAAEQGGTVSNRPQTAPLLRTDRYRRPNPTASRPSARASETTSTPSGYSSSPSRTVGSGSGGA